MTASSLSVFDYHDLLQQYKDHWNSCTAPPSRSRESVAFAILEHAAKLEELTGDAEFVDTLRDPSQLNGLRDLVFAACRNTNTTDIEARAEAMFKHDAFSESDLESFGQMLVETDTLRSVLDTASRLTDTIEDPDVSIAVGEVLFKLDELIEFLYKRPDVISVCWRAVQNHNGSVPGWLIRAKTLDNRDRTAQPLAPRQQEPDTQTKERLGLVQKLLRATTPKCIRVFRNIPLPKEGNLPAGTPLLNRLQSPDTRFELELLSGPEPGSIGLEFTSRNPAFANVLFGYVLAPGPDGVGSAGFAVATRTEEELYTAESLVPAGHVARLAGACNGITAGPVDLGGLPEADWAVVIASARSELATPRAPAWRNWAAEMIAGTEALPDRVRAELGALVAAPLS